MRAFLVAARAAVSYYNELFLLVGLSFFWWITGGIFLGAAAAITVIMFVAGPGGPWWLAPLIAIPAGPSIAAMNVVGRRISRDVRVGREFYMEGLKGLWRPALVLSAIGAVVYALLMVNILFYVAQTNSYLQLVAIAWVYLIILWTAIQFYAYPILVAMEQPKPLLALRTASIAAFANPLFSGLLVVVAAMVSALSAVLAVPLLMAWPALMALLGVHAFRLILQRAGIEPEEGGS